MTSLLCLKLCPGLLPFFGSVPRTNGAPKDDEDGDGDGFKSEPDSGVAVADCCDSSVGGSVHNKADSLQGSKSDLKSVASEACSGVGSQVAGEDAKENGIRAEDGEGENIDQGAYEAEDDAPVQSEMVDDIPLVDDEDDIVETIQPQAAGPAIGELELVFQYNGEARRMNVTIIKCHNLPSKEEGGASSFRLRLLLLPAKRQRAKTHIRESQDPLFKELFRFSRIFPHEMVSTALRCRLYACERMRRERLIGETLIKFSSLNVASKQIIKVRIEPRSESSKGGGGSSPYSSTSDLSDSNSTSSLQSLGHGSVPEILVGLAYNAATGRLDVEVIKGSHFKQRAAGRNPDSYVKVALMSSSGFEVSKSKTSVRRGQSNPTFKETFFFQVAQFQLPEMTLLFSVFNKKGMKRKESIGWFSMGLSNSSEEEISHWNEMRESKGRQVCRWHSLLES